MSLAETLLLNLAPENFLIKVILDTAVHNRCEYKLSGLNEKQRERMYEQRGFEEDRTDGIHHSLV
jgi:hypothetical protein